MKVLENRFFAAVIMVLTVFVAIVPIGHAPIGTALTTILIMLTVFVMIDIVATSLSKTKGKLISTIIAAVAIVAIGLSSNMGDTVNYEETTESSSSSQIETEAEIEKTDTVYELGMSYYEMGEYEKAITTLSEVDDSSDYYLKAQTALTNAIDQYLSNLIDTAKTYVERNDYVLAIDILNAGLLVIPQDDRLVSTINEYTLAHRSSVRTAAIDSAEASAAAGDYANAFLSIQGAIDIINGDVELEALSNKYATDYRNDILIQSEVLLHSEGYESAIQLVQSAMTVLPGDRELDSVIEEYEEYSPVYLIENIDYLTKTEFSSGSGIEIENTSLTDCDGNVILGHYHIHNSSVLSWYPASITFDLSGEFKSFCGMVVLPEEYKHTKYFAYISVYGDGNLLYQSPGISAGFHTDKFTIDVDGVSTLRIEMVNDTALTGGDRVVGYLTNAYLSKLEVNG
ncbi:MAG: NPCBM/NEW2 domain-containing protein [Oscillospiraceae bacterium]|nr:NPCBM/NEW2 domain-containing protein [Oscillospiraceae bacterium]